MQTRLQTRNSHQHQGGIFMLKKSPIPVVVQTTVVNLLREHYPMLTAEMLFTALDQYGNPRETVVRKKLTRRECAQLLGVSVNSINRYIKSGHLKAVNISPRLVRIEPESVQNLLEHGVPENEIIVPQCHGKAGAR